MASKFRPKKREKLPLGRFGIKQAIVSAKFRFTSALMLMAGYAVLEAIFTLFVNRLFSAISDQGGKWAEIAAPLSILLSLWVFQIIISTLSALIRSRMEVRYTKHILNQIFIHLSEIDQSVLDQSNSGEIIARTVEDSKIASKLFIRPVIRISTAIITFCSAFVVLATIAWQPTLILVGISVVIAIVTILSTKRLETLSELSRAESSKLWGSFFDAFKNIKFIKVNNLQEDYREMVRTNADNYQNRELKSKNFSIWLSTAQQMLFLLSWGATLTISIYYNTIGVLSVAGVVSFILSAGSLRGPLVEISDEIQSIREINVSFARLNTLMLFKAVALNQQIIPIKAPDLIFKDVDFSYDGKRALLEKSSFKLSYGKTYAIVGKTGSGKSTIFDILTGTYPVTSGKVMVGNLNLDKETIYSARHAISISYQLPFLLNDTIERNVRILNPDISDDELNRILHATQVDQIIAKLPLGIKSRVGENGVQLSGGERKRIQIAQSLAKKAEIYMFDELTASLDQKTARTMMEAIRHYLDGKTVIFIEHRLNMIEHVDEIYEFKNKTLERVDLHAITDR